DLEARVVGDRGQSRLVSVIERFQPRVLGEGGAGLFGLRDAGKACERDELHRQARKNASNLAQLSCGGCREQEVAHAAATALRAHAPSQRPQRSRRSQRPWWPSCFFVVFVPERIAVARLTSSGGRRRSRAASRSAP